MQNIVSAGITWLKDQEPATVKDISRTVQALSIWGENPSHMIETLLSKKMNSHWETQDPILDTARVCSSLSRCGKIGSDTLDWMLAQQSKNGSWNNREIDTAYSLIALGDYSMTNEAGCEWLFQNYDRRLEHIGNTSLIITALLRQNRKKYEDFIRDRSNWLLSKRESGGWIYIATSNLAIQALILAGEMDIDPSIRWLLKNMKKDNWGDIVSTALSLISLNLYQVFCLNRKTWHCPLKHIAQNSNY